MSASVATATLNSGELRAKSTMAHPLLTRNGLYAITDGPRDDLVEVCEAAIDGGAVLLQYRDKTGDAARRLAEASALAASLRASTCRADRQRRRRPRAAIGAAGVHLGEHDADIAVRAPGSAPARSLACRATTRSNVPAHSRPPARTIVAFGAFHPSPTKPHARTATPHCCAMRRRFGLPLVAIGGITSENGAALIEAGANYLAAISSIFGARDVRAAAREFTALFGMHS